MKKENNFINKTIHKIFAYIKLLRVHHYLKNALILLPIFFGRMIGDWPTWSKVIPGFFAFCLLSSFVYIINDIKDRKKDANHPKKCHRPIASGDVSIVEGIIIAIVLIAGSVVLNYFAYFGWESWVILGAYALLNIGYSFGLKNVPILDVLILASGFFIRTVYGAVISNIQISNWMYLAVIMFSFYLGFGKRRNELEQLSENDTRKVLKAYNRGFLDKFMYVSLALALVFYSLWCVDKVTIDTLGTRLIWTIPFVVAICMKYSLDIEGNSDGDPIEVILHDKILLIGASLFAVGFVLLIYL